MDWAPASVARWLFSPQQGLSDRLVARGVFLRALGLIYFSAFFSLVFQIRGLIGPEGILPASEFLRYVANHFGPYQRIWFAPSLLWFSAGNGMLLALGWNGGSATLGAQCLAAWDLSDLFYLLFIICQRSRGLFQLPIGWNAARSRIHLSVFCPTRFSARLGREVSAITSKSFSFALGMVPHLFRVRRSQALESRSAMA